MKKMHGTLLLSASLVAVALLLSASGAQAEDTGVTTQAKDPMSPLGLWKTIDDETGRAKSIIRIWQKDGKLYGTILKLFRLPDEDPDPICDQCPGKLHNKKIKGMTVLRGLTKDGNEWSGGTILDPKNGKTYRCFIQVLPGGKKLKVRGFVGISLLGRTQHWLRVK